MPKTFLWFFALLFTGCGQDAITPLKVGTNVWPGYECFYLARSLDYYQGSSIKLVEYTSSSDVIQAYRNGGIDAAALTMDEVFLLAEHKQNPRVVLITDFSNGGDVILGKPGIKELADLKGKRVGVEATALGAFVLTRALEGVGLTPMDVEAVQMEANSHEKAFKDGNVEAVVTFEPVRSNLLKAGAGLLFDSSQIPGEIVDVLVVKQQTLVNNPGSVKTLLKGWFKALDYLKNNPEDAARRIAPREGISPEQFLSALETIHIPEKKENLELLGGKNSNLHKGMDSLAKFMVKNDLLTSYVDPSRLIDDGPIRRK